MAKIIGIDLGTTNSVVAVMEGNRPTVLINPQGSSLTPSLVSFTQTGEVLVGNGAKRQQANDPKSTISSIKRLIGRRREEVTGEEKNVPYEIGGTSNERTWVGVRAKQYSPEQISAYVLQHLKRMAENYLGELVSEAVITVPAYFNDAQRKATKDAGEIAGLKVLRVLPETTAAALAYSLNKKKYEKIFVFDLGGGKLDVSCLDVGDDVFEILSINGNTRLGGKEMDEALVNHVAQEFHKQEGIDLRKDPVALQRLRDACEKAKIDLSAATETTIDLPFIAVNKNLCLAVSRATFEQLIAPLVEQCRQPVLDALRDAKLSPEQIDEVVLVGGSTRVPTVQRLIKELFHGKEPNKSVNPDEAVAVGAAFQAAIAPGDIKDVLVLDAIPSSLGVETLGGKMTPIIPRNMTIPTKRVEVFSTAADNQSVVVVNVLQGEREMAINNRLLGTFNLGGIPPAPRGVPQIQVTFDVDINGILNVSAKELGTQKESRITIHNAGNLTSEQIEKMKREMIGGSGSVDDARSVTGEQWAHNTANADHQATVEFDLPRAVHEPSRPQPPQHEPNREMPKDNLSSARQDKRWWQFWKTKGHPKQQTSKLKASRIYFFSSAVMDSDERQEALWGGFFAKHTAVDRSIAEYVQLVGGITYVEPKWQKGGAHLNLEHAAKLSAKVLDGLFDDEHKGGCYLDAILIYPDKPPVFVVMVWNAPVASSARQSIPGVQMGLARNSAGTLQANQENLPVTSNNLDDPIECFTNPLRKHIDRMLAASDKNLIRFVSEYLSPKIISDLAAPAAEKMSMSLLDGEEHSFGMGRQKVFHTICTLPFEYHKAVDYFAKKYGGYTELLGKLINSLPIQNSSCQVLCHIIYCRPKNGVGWVNMSILRFRGDEFKSLPAGVPIDLLTPAEKSSLGLK